MNNIRYGLITDIQPDTGRVRVTLPDMEDLPTDWLPVLQLYGTRNNKNYSLPDLNEQVAVLLDKHCNAGVVLGSIYSSEDKPDPANSGPGVYALKLVHDGAAVFLAKILRAAKGALSIWSKSSVQVSTETGDITARAGRKVELVSTAPIVVTAGGEKMHQLLKDIGTFLRDHKHISAAPGQPTPALIPTDIVTATALLVRIEKFTQD